MNAHTFHVLELEKVKEILSSMASSALGRTKAMDLTPSSDLKEIENEMDRVTELGSAIGSGEFSIGTIVDVRKALESCGREGFILAPRDLFDIASTLRTARVTRGYFTSAKERFPLLSLLFSGLGTFQEFEQATFISIDDEGNILDTASPELASIRRRREKLKETIREKLDSIMRSSRDLLQEHLVTLRQERYVIPIKTEEKGRMDCIVHDVSSSGATLFVEPLPVLDLNNELKQNRKSEDEEKKKILSRLSAVVRENLEDINRSVELLGDLDLLLAKTRFSSEYRCMRPEVDASGELRLKAARHPLLLAKKGSGSVVPLDLELGGESITLLVSGPNAGGKTVALKTVGMLILMCQCGMHVPADSGTRLSVFKSVFADIGDEQSIERDLSTFSSHMTNVVEIMRLADSSTLVLLDEVGVGTDPRSGTGIAMAVLSELTRRGARTVATSHYGDLKIFVQAAPRMSNACVEFDPETLLPTYRLIMGVPGSSNTFEMAERLGMDRSLLAEARSYALEGSTKAEEIIASLERSLSRSEKLAEEARRGKEKLDALTGEYEKRLQKLREEEKEAKTRRREQSRRALEKTRSLVENLVREIRESDAGRDAVKKVRASLAAELEKVEEPAPRAGSTTEVSEGDLVYVEPFKASGTVISLDKGSARVELDNVTLQVPLSSLKKSPARPEEREPEVRVPDQAQQFELLLLGMDREEALEALDRQIDRAFMSGLSVLRVVHGKGLGVLKKAVEEALRRDPRVESYREGLPEEGGWGVTLVKLKT